VNSAEAEKTSCSAQGRLGSNDYAETGGGIFLVTARAKKRDAGRFNLELKASWQYHQVVPLVGGKKKVSVISLVSMADGEERVDLRGGDVNDGEALERSAGGKSTVFGMVPSGSALEGTGY